MTDQSAMSSHLPLEQLQHMVGFGPDVNCTLDLCPLEMSVTGYLPSLAINIIFIVLYAFAMVLHLILGIRWMSWWYMACCVTCTISGITGSIGRIFMHYDPFGFYPFLIQGVFLTIVPVFYCAGIYVTLAMAMTNLAPELARFNPRLFPWIFLPFDVAALCAQVVGAIVSAMADVGSAQVHHGEQVSIVGLGLQVGTIFVFCLIFLDFGARYFRTPKGATEATCHDTRLRFFFGTILTVLVLTTARSGYRVAELGQGYTGSLMREEGLFIMMEGCAIVICVFLLTIGHPGFVFGPGQKSFERMVDDDKDDRMFRSPRGDVGFDRLDGMELRLLKMENAVLSAKVKWLPPSIQGQRGSMAGSIVE